MILAKLYDTTLSREYIGLISSALLSSDVSVGGDNKVKVTSNDTTADYLQNKLNTQKNILLTEQSDGLNEAIAIRGITSVNKTILDDDYTLTVLSPDIELLDPDSANRIVALPTGDSGSVFTIKNNGDDSNYLDVQFLGSSLEKIYSRNVKKYAWDGSQWVSYSIGTIEPIISLGLNSIALTSSIAIGISANAKEGSTALGNYVSVDTDTSHPYKIAIGSGSGLAATSSDISNKGATIAKYRPDGITVTHGGIAIGNDTYIQGDYSIAFGQSNKVIADRAIALGNKYAKVERTGEIKENIGIWDVDDSRSWSIFSGRQKTLDTETKDIYLMGKSYDMFTIKDHSIMTFDIMVTAIGVKTIGGDIRHYGAHFRGVITREGATIEFTTNEQDTLQSPAYNKESWKSTNIDWIGATSVLTASSNALRIQVTGASGYAVKWASVAKVVELTNVTDSLSVIT